MNPTITLKLGDFTFSGLEVPPDIVGATEQRFATHELLGGARVTDAMGAAYVPPVWSGRFQGSNAEARARKLDQMTAAGKQLKLTWSQYSYTVLITSFRWRFERFYQILYTLTVEIIQDNVKPPAPGAPTGLAAMLKGDLSKLGSLAGDIASGNLSAAVSDFSGVVSGVGDIARAGADGIATITNTIASVKDNIATLKNVAQSIASGNILDIPAQIAVGSKSVSDLLGASSAVGDVSNLLGADSLLSRIGVNVSAVGQSGAQVTQAGGDLYRLATDRLGDVNAWPDIANANGLTDPILTGVNTLTIPPLSTISDSLATL